MKICVISLNACNGRELSNFFIENNVNSKYFYDFRVLELGSKEETLDGVKNYFDSIYDDYDAFLEFPISFCFEHAYEVDPDTKFIYCDISKDEWIQKMRLVFERNDILEPYLFEEFFCNHYTQTGKVKMLDLTDEELSDIYDAHVLSVDTFFQNKNNFLKLNIDDADFLNKVKDFLNL